LVIEIEISQRLLNRVGIYAAMGVPELWRYDGKRLRVQVLRRGVYQDVDKRPTFPALPLRQVERFVQSSFNTDETSWVRRIRRWVQQNMPAR